MNGSQYKRPSSQAQPIQVAQLGNTSASPYAAPHGTIKQFNEQYKKFWSKRGVDASEFAPLDSFGGNRIVLED